MRRFGFPPAVGCVMLAVLPGCTGSSGSPAPPPATPAEVVGEDPPAAAGAKRLLALGDSYTIGEGVPAAERWPVQLAALLRGRGVETADPTIVAKTGWTTDELSAALDRSKVQGPYALVSLLIGVNNQYRGRDVEEYRKQFVALLNRAIGYAGGRADRVIVVSIPDWGVTPFAASRDRAGIAAAIDRFNAVNREETAKLKAHYIDITPGSRKAANDPGLIAGDGLHPSGAMYAEWAKAALPAAEAALTGAKSKPNE